MNTIYVFGVKYQSIMFSSIVIHNKKAQTVNKNGIHTTKLVNIENGMVIRIFL